MARRPKRNPPSGGFTLFELVAVLVVMAMAAGAVAISVRGHVSNARLEMFFDQLETFDGSARATARRQSRSVVLTIDASAQGVTQVMTSAVDAQLERALTSPRGVEITHIRTMRQATDRGVLRLAVSPLGQTDTYALRLQATSGRGVWLVVLGMSGQCLRFDKEQDVEEIFSLQRGAVRYDAG